MKYANSLISKLLLLLRKDQDNTLVQTIVAFSSADAEHFAALMELFVKGPGRITQRATAPILKCLKINPLLLIPHEKRILTLLERNAATESVKRNTLRIFSQTEHTRAVHARLIKLCFALLSDPREAIAIKVFSMSILANLASRYPELKGEVKSVVEDLLNYSASPGIHARGRKILKVLRK